MASDTLAGEDVRTEIGNREITAVLNLFSGDKEYFSGDHAKAAASSIISQQNVIHRNLFDIVAQWQKRNTARHTEGIIRVIKQYSDTVVNEAKYSIKEEDEGIFVESEQAVPFIRESDLDKFQIEIGANAPISAIPEYWQDFIALVVAGYLIACRRTGHGIGFEQVTAMSMSLRSATAKLEAFKLLQHNSDQLLPALAEAKAGVDSIGAKIVDQGRQLEKLVTEVGALEVRNQENLKYGDAFIDKVKEMEGQHDALMKSLEERLKLDQARNLWGTAGTNAAKAFYVSAIALIVILVAIPAIVFIWRADILAFLQALETVMVEGAEGDNAVAGTVSAISRLLILTAPLGFVVWLIRLLVRFNTRSMLLMDDAKQRVTMLNTYLFLIEQDAAVKQDRGAILEALFRRAPGHGSDSVDPPHFTELLRYGQESGTKPV